MNVPMWEDRVAPREALRAAFERVLASGRYVLGAEVDAFERALAAHLGARHAVGVSSGSDALVLALQALDVRPGDEVLCPAFSFFATAGAIVRIGARPVFVDVRLDDFSLDVAALPTSARPKAAVVVHLFGRCAEAAGALAVPVIEDVAQSLGARRGDRLAGSFGAVGCHSFFPTKNLGALGDGGAVVTDDEALAARIRRLRAHGAIERHLHAEVGANFRLDALQAAFLGAKLPHVEASNARRRAIARRYLEGLAASGVALRAGPFAHPGGPFALVPEVTDDDAPSSFVVRVSPGARTALIASLAEAGIETAIHYPRTLPSQPCFAERGSYPNAEIAAREVLALPFFDGLRADEVDRVIDVFSARLRA